MLKIALSIVLLFCVFTKVSATTGCVRNTNTQRIYTKLKNGSSTEYRSSPYSTTTSSSCNWVTTSSPCTITSISGGGLVGQDIQMCPIDSYVWMLLPIVAVLGYSERRKKIQHLAIL